MPQSTGWFSRMNCSVSRRRARTASESVSTRMPSVTGMLQAISIQLLPPPSPSTSTTQIRQLPEIDRLGCQQKVGMKKPAAFAACMTVWPLAAVTGCPLMKKSGMRGLLLGNVDFKPPATLRAPVGDVVLELVAVLGDDADRREACRIAHAADRRAVVGLGDAHHRIDVL